MAKKDTTSDWKEWILGRRKQEPPAAEEPSPGEGQSGSEPEPSASPAQTVPLPPPEPSPGEEPAPPNEPEIRIEPAPGPEPSPPTPPPVPEPPPQPVVPTPPEVPGDQAEARAPSSTRLPKNLFAHLALVDIGGGMKQTRGLPRFFPLKRTRTLAGRHVRAHILLDDEATVLPEHARILYEEKDGQPLFVIDPVGGGPVTVNGITVYGGGAVLANGDVIRIGSATLIFYYKDLKI